MGKDHEEIMALLLTVPGVKEHLESDAVKSRLERDKQILKDAHLLNETEG